MHRSPHCPHHRERPIKKGEDLHIEHPFFWVRRFLGRRRRRRPPELITALQGLIMAWEEEEEEAVGNYTILRLCV